MKWCVVLTVGPPHILFYLTSKGWSGGVTMEPIGGRALLQLAQLFTSYLSLSVLGGVWGLTNHPHCCLRQCSWVMAWCLVTWVWGDARLWCCPSFTVHVVTCSWCFLICTCPLPLLTNAITAIVATAAPLGWALGGTLRVLLFPASCPRQERPPPYPF